MRTQIPSLFLAASLALASGLAQAHTEVFTGSLLGTNEVPANASPGTGTARITLDLDLLTMRVQASFSGMLGNVTNAHIHCCTSPGTNVGVATPTPTFPGFPAGGTAGSYDQTFDMSVSSSYNAAFITAKGGTVGSAFSALVTGLESGQAYFNIHSGQFPGGELRANLAPIPEPQTYALMLGGLAVLGAVARRRKASAA